jgi:hypothetical protein
MPTFKEKKETKLHKAKEDDNNRSRNFRIDLKSYVRPK